MLKYIFRRLLMMIPVMLGVIVIVFTLLYITPGDPVDSILGDDATPEAAAGTSWKIRGERGSWRSGNLLRNQAAGSSQNRPGISKFPETGILLHRSGCDHWINVWNCVGGQAILHI